MITRIDKNKSSDWDPLLTWQHMCRLSFPAGCSQTSKSMITVLDPKGTHWNTITSGSDPFNRLLIQSRQPSPGRFHVAESLQPRPPVGPQYNMMCIWVYSLSCLFIIVSFTVIIVYCNISVLWRHTTSFNAEFTTRRQWLRICQTEFHNIIKFVLTQQLLKLPHLLMESGAAVSGWIS